MRTIDCRGLSCPQPLLMFTEAHKKDSESPMDVLVDNPAGRSRSCPARNRVPVSCAWSCASEFQGSLCKDFRSRKTGYRKIRAFGQCPQEGGLCHGAGLPCLRADRRRHLG